ncbi:MAG: protein kinase domain-containing protein [Steroidobacteraceae bacterium]
MLPEVSANWPVLSKLLDEVLALPPADRDAWLKALPAEHWALRETLRRLLEVQAGIETRPFLDTLPKLTTASTPVSGLVAGDEVGRYRLLEELGTGGMGCVWLAERADGQLKRKIALKLPRMVWADDLATRMARERDILGALDHPYIARLYDAGVDEKGRPYLALEYVEGQRIDAYCDARSLTLRQRIELFLQVVAAVQYAHVNLVIHRDIKPANVLINQQGMAKLLDFGIARLEVDAQVLQGLGEAPETNTRAMTPRYASPEQVRGERLSLASDVYSLGVLLYELLTGRSPYQLRNDSRAALEIAVTEGDIRQPSRVDVTPQAAQARQSTVSKLSNVLRGDLDAILMKALSLDAGNRYLTVQAFGDDLARWMSGEVILAKRAPAYEVVRKFVMRNRWPVSIASVSFIAVVATAIVAVWQAREARQESRRATATRDFLIALFDDANPELRGGKDVTARELLIEGEKRLPSALASEPELQAEVLLAIANVWARFGDVDRAQKATQLRRDQLRRIGADADVVQSLLDEAFLLMNKSDYDGARALVEQASVKSMDTTPKEKTLSDLEWSRGWIATLKGDVDAADKFFSSAEKYARTMADTTRVLRALYGQLQVAAAKKNRARFLEIYDDYELLLSESSLPKPEQMRRRFELATALYSMGGYRKGWPTMQRVFQDASTIYGEFSTSQEAVQLYWINWAIRVNELYTAEKWLIQRDKVIGSNVNKAKRLSEWIVARARLYMLSGKIDLAEQVIKSADLLANKLSPLEMLAINLVRAEIFIFKGDPGSAIRVVSRAFSGESLMQEVAQSSYYKSFYLGVSYTRLGQYARARAELLIAERESEKIFGRDHPRFAAAKLNRAILDFVLRGARNDLNAIRASATDAKAVLEKAYPEGHPHLSRAQEVVDCIASETIYQGRCRDEKLIRNIFVNS